MTTRTAPISSSSDKSFTQAEIREHILKFCAKDFKSLGEVSAELGRSKNTIRAGYIYPMVKTGHLLQEHPAGTKSAQRYRTNEPDTYGGKSAAHKRKK